MILKYLVPVLLSVLISGMSAAAQLQPGDLIVGDLGASPGVYAVTDTGTLVATLLTSYPDYPNAVSIWGGTPAGQNGQDLAVAMIGVPDRLLRLTTGGAVSTLTSLTHLNPSGLALEPDGSWLISSSGENGLHRFHPGSGKLTTLWRNTLGGRVNSIALNGDTGHACAAIFARTGPRIVEVDATGALIATLDKTISDISSVAWDPATGTYTVTDFINFDPAEFVRLDPATRQVTSLVSSVASHALNAHARTRRGTWWLAGGQLSGGGGLYEVTDRGVFVKSISLPWPHAAPTSVVIHGSRSLSTSGTAAPGSILTFHLSTRRAADRGKFFILLLSRATRPPLLLSDGRLFDLQIDTLAVNVLLGHFSAFLGGGTNVGIIDQHGNASALFTLPVDFPAGTGFRVFAAFAVVDPQSSSGFGTVSNTVGFTLK